MLNIRTFVNFASNMFSVVFTFKELQKPFLCTYVQHIGQFIDQYKPAEFCRVDFMQI